jgi:twitching motility protein PilT
VADGTDVFDVDAALRKLVSRGGSDLHLKAHAPPLYRIYATLGPQDDEPELSPEETEEAMRAVMSDPDKKQEFERENEADFSFEIPDVSRFRVNAFRQRGLVSLAFRAIPNEIRTVDDLQLPPVVRELAEEERGIILLTGTTGSGKSTTLAAMIDHINFTMAKHVVTIEDPIEYVHSDKRSAINQREVGMDTASFGRAMRRVLRQDPDVILIGEMRDEETVRAALSAAETGHLVLSTVHTLDASESINRILDFFPPHQHSQARAMIAGTLKGVISQRLVRSVDGKRVAVCEVLRMTGRVRDMIKDPEQMGKLGDVIFTGGYYGMQTFDQALFKHVKAKRVAFDDALRAATSPHDFKLLVEADGKRGTTMDDVAEAAEKRPGGAPSSTPAPAAPGAASAGAGAVTPGAGGAAVTPGAGGAVTPGVGAVTPGAGNGVSPGAGNGVSPGAGNGVTPGAGNGVTPGAGTAAPAPAGASASGTNGATGAAAVTPGVGAGVSPGAAAAVTPGAGKGVTPGAGVASPGAAEVTTATGSQPASNPANAGVAAGNGAPAPASKPAGNGAPPAGTPAATGGGLNAGAAPSKPPSSAAGGAVQVGVSTPPQANQLSSSPAAGLTPGAGASASAASPARPPAPAPAPATGSSEATNAAPASAEPENGRQDAASDGSPSAGTAPAKGVPPLKPGVGS